MQMVWFFIAKREDGLQKILHSLYSFCARYKLTVNTSKSKIMHFSKMNNKRDMIYYGTSPLEWVDEFKYLGIKYMVRRNFTTRVGRLIKISGNQIHCTTKLHH